MRENFRLAKRVHESGATSAGSACSVFEKNKHHTSRGDTRALVSPAAKIRTNHHDGELDTLFGLVSSASASERHGDVKMWGPFAVVGEGERVGIDAYYLVLKTPPRPPFTQFWRQTVNTLISDASGKTLFP